MDIITNKRLGDLICAIAQGDASGISEIYELLGKVMYTVAKIYVTETADIEDIIHDSLLKIVKNAKKFRENKNAYNRQVSFQYYSLDYRKNKVFHNDGKRYIVNPLVVVWNKDNYYLICYDDKHEGTATYRIDRIAEAHEESTERTYRKDLADFDVEQYRQKVFSMFSGEEQEIVLQFNADMLDDVFDKFGEEVNIVKVDDITYRLKVPIQVSKTFFAWVVGTQGKMRIKSPKEVCERFDAFVKEIKEEY